MWPKALVGDLVIHTETSQTGVVLDTFTVRRGSIYITVYTDGVTESLPNQDFLKLSGNTYE